MTEKQITAIKRVVDSRQPKMTPADAAEIIQVDPQTLRGSCRRGTQGFPISIEGEDILIPVRDFFQYWGIPFETPEEWNVYERRKEDAGREGDYRRYTRGGHPLGRG